MSGVSSNEVQTLAGTVRGTAWLELFETEDQADATRLLEAVRWVSEAEFSSRLRELILEEAKTVNGMVGLLLERKVPRPGGYTQRFYKESAKRPRRAYGEGLKPIDSLLSYKQQVGSAGVIGTLATALARESPQKFVLHPTAEKVRNSKIRAFFVLTDTIGTGEQVSKYLDSLWKVASVKSWVSMDFLTLNVISYAATDVGVQYVSRHASNPKVVFAYPAPTIGSEFNRDEAQRMWNLCEKYDPEPPEGEWGFLGYGGLGVLLAYAHGVPNNVPNILFKKGKNWTPLFPARTAVALKDEMPTGFKQIDESDRLERMNQQKLAASTWLEKLGPEAKELVLVMASLSRPPRSFTAIAKRTGIRILQVKKLLALAAHNGWLGEYNRLTDEGRQQLEHLRKQVIVEPTIPKGSDAYYYPKSLGAP